MRATAAESRYMGLIARLPCVVCVSLGYSSSPADNGPVEVHHVAEGSGERTNFGVAPLCVEHHRGSSGLHGMGTKAFCALYRPPFDNEYGLLVWTAQELEKLLWQTGKRIAA
jgi:hypothetical protein